MPASSAVTPSVEAVSITGSVSHPEVEVNDAPKYLVSRRTLATGGVECDVGDCPDVLPKFWSDKQHENDIESKEKNCPLGLGAVVTH